MLKMENLSGDSCCSFHNVLERKEKYYLFASNNCLVDKENKEFIRMLKVADDFTKQCNNKNTYFDEKSKITCINISREDLRAYWEDEISILWKKYFCFKETINKDNVKKAKDLKDLSEINVYVLKEEEDKYLLKEVRKIILF